MLDLKISDISSAAGAANDGVVRGKVNQSTLEAVFLNNVFADNIFALRKDATASGGELYTDVSASAVADISNNFLPWGSDADFSANDELWLAADRNLCEIYVHVTTPGVWTGTGLSIFESLDGQTLVPVAGLVDTTNGFRNAAGVYRISFTLKDERQNISPQFGGTKRKYIVLKPNGLTAKTTSPKLKKIWVLCQDGDTSYADLTAISNAATTDTNFSTIQNNVFLSVDGVTKFFGLKGISSGMDFTIHRKSSNANTNGFYEYLASDNTWKLLKTTTSADDPHTQGPTNLGDPVATPSLRWTIPTDWTAKAITFAPSTTPVTAFWVRLRIQVLVLNPPIPIALSRVRSRSFGSGLTSGIYHADAKSYKSLTYDFGVPPLTDMVANFTVAETGVSKSATFPANVRSSSDIAAPSRLDLTGLNVGIGQSLLISHVSGGTAQDAELHLE